MSRGCANVFCNKKFNTVKNQFFSDKFKFLAMMKSTFLAAVKSTVWQL